MDDVVLQTQCCKCPKERKKSMVMKQYMLKAMLIIRTNVVKGAYIIDSIKKPKSFDRLNSAQLKTSIPDYR